MSSVRVLCAFGAACFILSGCVTSGSLLPQDPTTGLAGTSWQFVQFEGSDGQILKPDDPSRYTVDFGVDGNVSVRLDCNRGRGEWRSTGPSQLELMPLALTRAMCAQMVLHDQIARQWMYVRSYLIRDGHLFLSLMADGGIYELEPTTSP